MPFFSVIIPVYNKEKFVAKTLDSVLSQTFTDFEIIIVNDGSTDLSEVKIKESTDSRIRYFFQENQGVSAAKNFGLTKATAGFICFIDADDYWYPGFLETMHIYIQKLPQEKVFGTAYEIETSKKTLPAQYSIDRTNDYELADFFRASLKESVICTSSVAIHKDVFATVGNFDTTLRNLEDIDLWIRIGLKYNIVFIWKLQARYVFDPKGLSRNKKEVNRVIDFSRYTQAENNNPDLKLYLDYNRFSLAIKSKLLNDDENFRKHYHAINMGKLPLKKKILLGLPPFALKLLIAIKLQLANIGLGNSVFR